MSLACINAAIKEVDNIADEELRDSLRIGLKQLAESKILNDQERLVRAKLLMREERAKIYQQEVANIRSQQLLDEWILNRFTGDAEHDVKLLADLVRQSTDVGPRTMQTLESRVLAAKQAIKGAMHNMVKEFGGRDGDYPILLELIQAGMSKNPRAAELVAQYRATVEPLLKRLHDDAGVFVEPDYQYYPQRLSPAKIAANPDEFMAEQAYWLRTDWHPDTAESAKRYYATMVTRHMSEPDKQLITMSRQMHYRTDDPEGLAKFLIKYSEDTVARQLERSAEHAAEALVVALQAGPNPGKLITGLREHIIKRTDFPTHPKRADLESELGRIEDAWHVISGQFSKPQNANAAQLTNAAKNTAGGLLLGYVNVSQAVQDQWLAPVLLAQRVGGGYGRGLADFLHGMGRFLVNKDTRNELIEQGFFEHMFHMGSSTARYSMEGTAEGIAGGAKRFGTIAYAATGAWHLEQWQRAGVGFAYHRGLIRNLQTDWKGLDTRFQTFLASNGVDEKTWAHWQKNHRVTAGGLLDVESMGADQAILLGGLMHTSVNNTILRPDAWTRALMTGFARAGTVPGVLAGLTTHLMSWPVQFVRSATMTAYKRGLTDVAVLGVTAMAGAIAYLQVRALLKGEPMYEWDSPTLWLEAMKRSALLTPLGDPIIDVMSGQSIDSSSFVSSAALGIAARVATNVAKGTASFVFEDDTDKALSYMTRAGFALTPNIWWLDATLRTPAQLAIMETIDPDWMRQRERRFKKEGRQGYN